MIKPDFEKYSLILIHENRIIFSSEHTGLRPLLQCVMKNKKKHCILQDRAIGLAAAKLIVYSGTIDSIIARVASRPAVELLKNNNISITAETTVDHILRKDAQGICPMELLAAKIEDPKEFFDKLRKNFQM